jgi:hypothetical protein
MAFLASFGYGTGDLKVRGSALQALGGLCIARPTCMLSERARQLQKTVLHRNAAHDFKLRALNNLADLLKVSIEAKCNHYVFG